MLKNGDAIGPYQLSRLLGRGGMGSVFQAHQASLQRDVAIKVIRPELLAQPEHAERFRREMQALARLSHPNVVKVYESGSHGELAWFAMELVPGASLAELLRPEQPLPLSRVRTISEGLLSAVAYLHDQGLLHRDIKPSNVQVPDGEPVKLMDFGLVKDVAGTLVTAEGATVGTPRYMAPEVLMGDGASIASDLYQVGLMIFQMLTGRFPIEAASIPELMDVLQQGRITPLRSHRPDLPESLEVLLRGLLANRPEVRPQPAALVWQRLSATLEEATLTTGAAVPATPPPRSSRPGTGRSKVREPSTPTPTPRHPGGTPDPGAPSSRGRTTRSLAPLGAQRAAAAIAAGVFMGLLMVVLMRKPRPDPGPTRSASASASASVRAPLLAADLPLDHWAPSAVQGGFTFAQEVLPGRRVTLPRGLAVDARGRLFVGSAEGLSWFENGRWSSRALVPTPGGMALLCADAREGVWARVRLDTPVSGTDSWLVRADERGVLERVALPAAFGRPSSACRLDNGDLLVATSGKPFRRHHSTGTIAELPTPGVERPQGFFASGARAGAWTGDRAYLQDGGGWHAVDLPGGKPGPIRGASIVGGWLWVCGERGAVAVALDGVAAPLRVLEDRVLSGAFDAGDPEHVLFLGPSGIFRQVLAPLTDGRPPPGVRLMVPGVEQAGIANMGAASPGEVWALTTTPLALIRVTISGVTVDSLPASDPDAARAEQDSARTLYSMPGMCIPYAWLDAGSNLAAGRRGSLVKVPLSPGAAAAPVAASQLSDAMWPMDLWLASAEGPLYMIWQREGTSNRYLDVIDPRTGGRRRAEGLPEIMDGPVRVSPDARTVYQGPFIPIVQLLESGVYVRYHGARPMIDDMHGVKDPVLSYWQPAQRVAGTLPLPGDYKTGALTFDPASSEAVYLSRDGRVMRRVLSPKGPGAGSRIAFPGGVDERAIAELELSPGGDLLAYVMQPRATGRSSLHVLDIAARESRLVGSYLYDYAQPRWSPDGRKLAFVRRGVDLSDAQLAARSVRR